MHDQQPDPPETEAEPEAEPETIDEPVLEGATEPAPHVDPREGDDDPALIRNLKTHEPTVNPYG